MNTGLQADPEGNADGPPARATSATGGGADFLGRTDLLLFVLIVHLALLAYIMLAYSFTLRGELTGLDLEYADFGPVTRCSAWPPL